MTTRVPVPLRRAKRSFQRRYRRAWLERCSGLSYTTIVGLVHRAGCRLRELDDREVLRVARERFDAERASGVARDLSVKALASALRRSERWVRQALAELGLEAEAMPTDELFVLVARRERARRTKIASARRKRAA